MLKKRKVSINPSINQSINVRTDRFFELDKIKILFSWWGEGWMDGGFNPLPDDKFLDKFKLKQSADDNLKFDENSRKFSKWIENTLGKGEIARYEQFLLFPQCFQKAGFPGASKSVTVWECVRDV